MRNSLTTQQKDALMEALGIAANNASSSLSVLLNKKVEVHSPKLHMEEIQNMPHFIGDPREIRTIILVQTGGDLPGYLLISFDTDSVLHLLRLLTGKKVEHIEVMNEFEKSALREIGNILTGSAITALNNILHFEVDQSIPDAATDMIGAIFNNIMGEIGLESDSAIEYSMDFNVEGEQINGKLIGILSPLSTEKTMKAINNKYKPKK